VPSAPLEFLFSKSRKDTSETQGAPEENFSYRNLLHNTALGEVFDMILDNDATQECASRWGG